jgi:hypothetical protein
VLDVILIDIRVILIDIDDIDDDAALRAGPHERAQRLRDSSPAPDDLAQIIGVDLELDNWAAIAFALPYDDVLGIRDELLGQKLEQPSRSGLRRYRIGRLTRRAFARNEALAAARITAWPRGPFIFRLDLVDDGFAGRDLSRTQRGAPLIILRNLVVSE